MMSAHLFVGLLCLNHKSRLFYGQFEYYIVAKCYVCFMIELVIIVLAFLVDFVSKAQS